MPKKQSELKKLYETMLPEETDDVGQKDEPQTVLKQKPKQASKQKKQALNDGKQRSKQQSSRKQHSSQSKPKQKAKTNKEKLKDEKKEIVTTKEESIKQEKNKEPLSAKEMWHSLTSFLKSNYISVELMLGGFLLLLFGFLPAIKIISYQFLESLNVSISYFQISSWMFSFENLSAESAFLSLCSLLYILSAFAMMIVGVLILLNVIKKNIFTISSILHLVSFVLIMCFFASYAVWLGAAKDSNLIATGIDIIYFNFSTSKFYTLVYFNLSVVMIAYTALYAYHNKDSIFKINK